MTGKNEHPNTVHRTDNVGIRRGPLTLENLKAFALARLGGPLRDVEITNEQFEVFLSMSLEEYSRWLPVEKSDVLSAVTAAINEYNLDLLEKPYGRGVINCSIGTKENFFSPISGVFSLGIPHPISSLSPDEYDLALRYIKTAKKVYSSESDWRWEEPVLWLYSPTGHGGPFVASYTYLQDHDKPEDIPNQDHSWFKKYFSTWVTEAVGETRGKYGSIPGPEVKSLRGEALVDKALREREALENDLKSRSYARTPPLWLGGGR